MIIITSGRSGSQRLMSSLINRIDIKSFEEIFNLNSRGVDRSLFNFDIPDNGKRVESHIHDRMCTEKYLSLANKKYDVFKLLYCHIKGDLYNALEGLEVIMLSRRNKFRCLVSLTVAKKNNIWCGSNPLVKKFRMDLDESAKEIKKMLREEDLLFKRYKPTIIYYEDDFQESYRTVCKKMGIPFIKPVVTTSPTGIRAEDIVENYNEIKELDREYYISEQFHE